MNPRSTDCKADALTTTPSLRLHYIMSVYYIIPHRVKGCKQFVSCAYNLRRKIFLKFCRKLISVCYATYLIPVIYAKYWSSSLVNRLAGCTFNLLQLGHWFSTIVLLRTPWKVLFVSRTPLHCHVIYNFQNTRHKLVFKRILYSKNIIYWLMLIYQFLGVKKQQL